MQQEMIMQGHPMVDDISIVFSHLSHHFIPFRKRRERHDVNGEKLTRQERDCYLLLQRFRECLTHSRMRNHASSLPRDLHTLDVSSLLSLYAQAERDKTTVFSTSGQSIIGRLTSQHTSINNVVMCEHEKHIRKHPLCPFSLL